MKFDRTFIAIRERTTLGIMDLSLHVLVDHFKTLTCLFLINVIPWIVLDYCLIGWMLEGTYDYGMRALYYWSMTFLVLSQAQLGTFLITQYLGKAMFEGRPGVMEVVKSAFSVSWYYWFSQFVLRTSLISLVACFLFDGESESTYIGAIFMMMIISIGVCVRAFRPFVTEILVLEKTPIRKKSDTINFSARSRSLHSFASSDLIGKAMAVAIISAGLVFSLHTFLVTFDQVMNIRANSENSLQPYYWVVSLWLVVGFMSVVRFLFYIDLRIRQEGWAVELRMRAEAQRLEHSIE